MFLNNPGKRYRPPVRAGNHYGGTLFVNVAQSGQALTANTLYAVRYVPSRTAQYNAIGIRIVTGGLLSHLRVGIYADDGNGNPGALIQDLGIIDSSTTNSGTSQSLTISPSITLNEDVPYYICGVTDVAFTPYTNGGSSGNYNIKDEGYSADVDTRPYVGHVGTFTYGALPATFPSSALTLNAVPDLRLVAA